MAPKPAISIQLIQFQSVFTMKKIYVLSISMILSFAGFSQSCLPEGIRLATQAQIDNFQVNYPGCTRIEGDVTIHGDDIVNLIGLNVVTGLGGLLRIQSNGELENLTGLENVTEIGGDLVIEDNSSLKNLAGLGSINASSISGLTIRGNLSLTDCEVQSLCEYLANPNGIVEISFNGNGCKNPPQIANKCGMNLPCLPFGNYFFYYQNEIDNFQVNYPGCTELEGDLTIYGPNISNLQGLSNLTSIGGNLWICEAYNLNSLSGLENLTSIGGDLHISDNDGLGSLSALQNLNSISGSIRFEFNTTPVNPAGLGNLTSVGGDIRFYHNAGLTSLTGLEGIYSIGGNLEIEANDILSNLTGLEGLTSVEGNVEIGSNDSLISISGLQGLALIGGNLFFNNNGPLASLSGLENLTSIGGSLEIHAQFNLPSLEGLDGLTSIGQSLSLNFDYGLLGLSGLENLNHIGNDILITNNPILTSLAGLDNLDAGSIRNLSINDNAALTDCEILGVCNYLSNPNGIVDVFNNAGGCNSPAEVAGNCGVSLPCLPYGNYYIISQEEMNNFQTNYPGCTELNGDVIISGEDITNLDGLIGLSSIGGSFNIRNNGMLTDISGLVNLLTLGGSLSIDNNVLLATLTGLENLDTVQGSLSVRNNNSLTSLTGLANLKALSGGLSIYNNIVLTSLSGLENLSHLGGSLSIDNNDQLTNLMGLNGLTSIGSGLQINNNDNLLNFTGLEGLTFIPGSVQIAGNSILSSFAGLNNVITIDGKLSIGYYFINTAYGNPLLLSLTGLEHLTSINGSLQILDDPRLETLEALENLTSINGDLFIGYCGSLHDLYGLENLDGGTIDNLTIFHNGLLSTCDIESICTFLENHNGTTEFSFNDDGCETQAEVEAACEVGLNENSLGEDLFKISPNPSSTQITIETSALRSKFPARTTNIIQSGGLISIFNLNGQDIRSFKMDEPSKVVDISDLPGGIYFVRMTGERTVCIQKFIKID